MGPADFIGPKIEFEVIITLPSKTPVVGVEINPCVRVNGHGSGQPPPHTLNFTWYRQNGTCNGMPTAITDLQNISPIDSDILVKENFCAEPCLVDSLDSKPSCHHCGDQALCQTSNDDGLTQETLTNASYLHASDNVLSFHSHHHNLDDVKIEEITWIKLGSSRTYIPSSDDMGSTLKLECVPTDNSTGVHLSPVFVILTNRVILSPARCPRRMISVGSAVKSGCLSIEAQSISSGSFTVLSYNILADLYASRNAHWNTPAWALTWEYRRQNLLNEIIGYKADILCLQEVQSDHFETFLKPEMERCGYSSVYKKKTKEVYTANQYIIDGCAIFFRHDKFKEIITYELEFDNSLFPVVDMLEPYQRNEVCFRLMKGNIAIVLILESVENASLHNGVKSRICVANTHIHADSSFQDAKMFQVVNFIKGLEKISNSDIPLIVCGDMNSVPRSDPHKFVLDRKIRRVHSKFRDPLGILKHLEFSHSMHLASAYSSLLKSDRVEGQQKGKMDHDTREPQFTNFGSGHPKTLDYIFYTDNILKVDELLELLDKRNIGGPALPSPLWSSDHIALMASFSYKQGYTCQHHLTPQNPWKGKTPGLKLLLMEDLEDIE